MKSPLSKFREMTLRKSEPKKERKRRSEAKLDELVQATKDMQDLKSCFDSLMSIATSAANDAYEFSESIKDFGAFLLEKIELKDDEDSGRALMMMGRAQFELQKLFNAYRSHIFQTMAKPSACLLRELDIVEDMKRECDEKREVYKNMLATYKTKGRSFHAKSRTISSKELQEAQVDYEWEADQFVFRLKSLKEGQFRSLLTQTARHHAAQLSFFRKGLEALEMVEPHVKAMAKRQHIDYQFKELDDNILGSDYSDDDYDDDRELSFGHQHTMQDDVMSISRNSFEETTDKSQADLHIFNGRPRHGSQSAPIFSEKKFDPSENIKESHPSSARKFHSYVLPTPDDDKNPVPSNTNTAFSKGNNDRQSTQLWFSSPLDAKGDTKDLRVKEFSSSTESPGRSSIVKENIVASAPISTSYFPKVPTMTKHGLQSVLGTKVLERQAFSGPITSKPFTAKPEFYVSQYESCMNIHPAKLSEAVPPKTSTPKISELHELPRPPIHSGKMEKPPPLVGHSAPLIARGQALPLPLPTPPMSRSFSIPSGGVRAPKYTAAKLSNATKTKVVSTPLTPIFLVAAHPVSAPLSFYPEDTE